MNIELAVTKVTGRSMCKRGDEIVNDFEPGTAIWYLRDNDLWPGIVLKKGQKRVKISYRKYDGTFKAWVSPEKLDYVA